MTTNLQLPAGLWPSVRTAGPRRRAGSLNTDRVYVVYTGIEETIAAARVAGPFAEVLGVPLTIVHFRTVPYPLPLDASTGISPIETAAFLQRLQNERVDARMRVYLCRNEQRTMPRALPPHSLVVLGGSRHWWTTSSERWRRALEVAGHLVITVDPSDVKEPAHA